MTNASPLRKEDSDPVTSIDIGDFSGAMVPQDLLLSDATIGFTADCPLDGVFFEVSHPEFRFKSWAHDGVLNCVRNQTELAFPAGFMTQNMAKVHVTIRWTATTLSIAIFRKRGGRQIWVEGADTPPTLPPTSLIRWAREQELAPVRRYKTEEELRQKVYSILESLQMKVSEVGRTDGFWDVERDGNTIVSRSPKREPDLCSLLKFAMYDSVFLAGLELVPEYSTDVGDVDFVFLGSVDEVGLCSVCVEVNTAHSSDLVEGLTKQLPSYMVNKNVQYGAYLVLWFKGEWFDKPSAYDSSTRLDSGLTKIRLDSLSASPRLEGVRVFVLDLSKPPMASEHAPSR